jgi:hypothetical protein
LQIARITDFDRFSETSNLRCREGFYGRELNADARRRRRSDQSFRFKSERLDHRHPVSVADRLDGADDVDGTQSDDGDMLACVLS